MGRPSRRCPPATSAPTRPRDVPRLQRPGHRLEVDPDLIVGDPTISLLDGALRFFGNMRKRGSWLTGKLDTLAEHYGVALEQPWQDLPQRFPRRHPVRLGRREDTLHLEQRERRQCLEVGRCLCPQGGGARDRPARPADQVGGGAPPLRLVQGKQPCPTCHGDRLCAEARAVTLGSVTLPQVSALSIDRALEWVDGLYDKLGDEPRGSGRGAEGGARPPAVHDERGPPLPEPGAPGAHAVGRRGAAHPPREPAQLRADGGAVRAREPSIGLHARDQHALLDTLAQLRDLGNTVLVVEHDMQTMRGRLDRGPGTGRGGARRRNSGRGHAQQIPQPPIPHRALPERRATGQHARARPAPPEGSTGCR